MSAPGPRQHAEIDGEIRARENQAEEDLAAVRLLEVQWDDYRQVMHENTGLFEEASHAMGPSNYSVQKGLASRAELDRYVRQLADEQEEFLSETARDVRSRTEEELERLRQEKASASWD
jgi:hypothetical protein